MNADTPLSENFDDYENMSVDDILANAEKFMQNLGLNTDIVEEAQNDEPLTEEEEEEAEEDQNLEEIYALVPEEETPFYDPPVVIKKTRELPRIERLQLEYKYSSQDEGRFSEHGSHITEIRTLDSYERAIFLREDFVSNQFNIQCLYKIRSDIHRRDIAENINEFFRNNPLLMVNFCDIGLDRKTHKLLFKRREPSGVFYGMNFLPDESINNIIDRIMANEIQKPFNIEREVLARFICIRVSDDHFALIMTISRLIVKAFNEEEFFKAVFDAENPPRIVKDKGKTEDYSQRAAAYYHKFYKKLPPIPTLPRFIPDYNNYSPKTQRFFFNTKLYNILTSKCSDNRDMIMAILAAAWGLLQKQVNHNRETYFSLLASDHNLSEGLNASAGKVYPLPLRIIINDEEISISEIVGQILRQILTGRSIGCARMKYVLKPFGDPTDIFPCFLHFHDFAKERKNFSDTMVLKGYKLCDIKTFDAGKHDLNIYFEMKNDKLIITYRYNLCSFNPQTVTPLAKYFELAVGCLLLTYDKSFSVFQEIYGEQIKGWDNTFGTYML